MDGPTLTVGALVRIRLGRLLERAPVGARPHPSLPRYVGAFDAGLIPYRPDGLPGGPPVLDGTVAPGQSADSAVMK